MKTSVLKQALGLMALLVSSGAMAVPTVTMTPSISNPIPNGTPFYVVLRAIDMPENGGGNLAVRFDHTKVTFNSIQLCTLGVCPPPAGSGVATSFDFVSPVTTDSVDQKHFTFAVNSGTIPAGSSFDVVRINFTAASSGTGDAGIQIIDDGGAYCWGDPNNFVCYTGLTYNQATVVIAPPGPPLTADDNGTTAPDTPVLFDVLANDTGLFPPVTLSIKTNPPHGTAVVSGSPGDPSGIRVTYTPASGFRGTDSFAYTVTDSYGSTDATVTVVVSDPEAVTDTVTTKINTPIAIAIAQNDLGILDPVQVSMWQFPAHGTVQFSGSPGAKAGVRATFTPTPGYVGSDTFLYGIDDGTRFAIGTVNITVTPKAVNDSASTPANQPVSIAVMANDIAFIDPVTVAIVAGVGHGTLSVSGSPGPQAAVRVTYTPTAGYTGPDSFVYSATSSTGTDNATVVIAVNPVAVNDTVNAIPGIQLSINTLANDIGFTDPVTAGIFSGASKGTLSVSGSPGPQSGIRFLYTPNVAASGTDSFVYSVADINGTKTGTVTITFLPDTDQDGTPNTQDNCTLIANPDQRDTNGDGYGNMCDPDLNGDGTVNINDLNRLKARIGITPVVDVDTDLDGNGVVNINDLNRLKVFLGKPPGPSGLHPNCPPTCP